MKLVRVIILAACVGAPALAGDASANPAALPREQDRSSPYMRVFAVTQPPYGFVHFCARVPQECKQGPLEEQRFSATPARLSELDAINRAVNREIEPATDMEIYGVAEYWTIPTTRGDCEDYALLKRKRLLARGFSRDQIEATYNIARRIDAEEDALANAELVVTSTQNEVEQQYGLYNYYNPGRMAVIPPGADLAQFRPYRAGERIGFRSRLARYFTQPDKPLILALSRPDERKNILTLVEA